MIRKSATGVIVALAVIWGGGTWYTGTQIQPGVEKFIKDFNDAKKKGEHAYDMTLSYQNFDKGFFNSRFQMQMTFDNGAPDLNIKPGQKVVFDVDVEHGPLPITMLMHGNVIPALAAAKVNLVNNELTQPLFIAAKNKSPVEATLRFAFGGSFSTTLDVAPAEYGKFSFGEGQFTFNGDGSSLSNLDIEGKVEDIVLQLSPMNKVTAKSFTIDSLARLEEKKFPVGESESKFNQINIINHGEDVAQIDAFVAKTRLDRVKDKDYINVNLTYELDKLTKGNQQLGSGEWSLIAESIDPSAVRQFIIQYNIAMQKQLAAHPELAKAFFQVVSMATTAGFTTDSIARWPLFLPVLLLCSAFIGGCAGSTGGGLKVIRILLLFKQGNRELKRLVHPNAVYSIKLGNRALPERILEAVWGFFSAYALVFIVSMLAIIATGVDDFSAFASVVATLNNLGPGLGVVADNFTSMNPVAKWILIANMLFGRLEVFTLLVLFTPTFWRE